MNGKKIKDNKGHAIISKPKKANAKGVKPVGADVQNIDFEKMNYILRADRKSVV